MPPSLVQWGSSVGYEKDVHFDPSTYTSTFAAGPAEGNLLFLAISINQVSGAEITYQKPDGWTQVATWDCMTNFGEMGWYYRFATSGEGSVVEIADFEGPNNETWVMFITEYTDIDGDAPFHDGATFTGSQVDDFINSYTTATLSGTREMLYLSWGQWETAEMTQDLATIGSMFATILDGHYNYDRFIQADLIATNIRPAAANWSWTGAAARINAAIIGFSGSHQATVWVPPLTRTRRGIMGGIYSGINRGIL